MTTDDDLQRMIGSKNITDNDIQQFILSSKKPFDMRSSVWKPEDNARIEKLQILAKAFFEDLKDDNVIDLYDVFRSPIDPMEILKQTRNILSILTKLPKIDEFTGDDQFLILCALYLFVVEQINTLFLGYIVKIYYTLPEDVRKRDKIKKPNSKSTLRPVINVLQKYKSRQYSNLFSDIDINLRNAIGHFSFHFGEKDIIYNGKTISGQDFLILIRKMVILFQILLGTPQKIFANEAKEELLKLGYTVK